MHVIKVGRRGQITLPKTIRRWFNLKEGDRLAFIRRDDAVMLQPLTHTLLDLRGSIPVAGPQDFDREGLTREQAGMAERYTHLP